MPKQEAAYCRARAPARPAQREFTPTLAPAAVAAGADALFLEVHDDPDHAKSDPATVYPLDQLPDLLSRIRRIADAVATQQ